MKQGLLFILWLLVFSSCAEAQTGGEVYRTCLARNPWASASCDRTINSIFKELKSAGMKCEATEASTKAVTNAVFDFMHANPQARIRPIAEVVKDAVRLSFHCE